LFEKYFYRPDALPVAKPEASENVGYVKVQLTVGVYSVGSIEQVSSDMLSDTQMSSNSVWFAT